MLNLNVQVIVKCDRCNNYKTFDFGCSKKMLISFLRKEDWAIGKKCLCPSCRETPKIYHIKNSQRIKGKY